MMKITELDEYQEIAMSTLYSFENKGKQLEYAVLALCGESGELANVLKKMVYYGDVAITKGIILDELSDVLWYVACVADALNIRLSEVATLNINKVLMKEAAKVGANTTEGIIKEIVEGITEQIKEGVEIAEKEAKQDEADIDR